MASMISIFDSLRVFRLRSISMIVATFALFVILLVIVDFRLQYSPDEFAAMESKDKFKSRTDSSASHRKLLQQGEAAKGDEEPNRIWGDRSCSSDVVISQGPTPPLPNGIPTYTVEITNVCGTGCKISALHLHCGWFSSARLINPRIFKRLKYDDCLVNNGKPLPSGRTISFAYANTFPYQLSVASVRC